MKFTTNKRKESVADVGNFEIAERRIDFGDADQRRKESGINGRANVPLEYPSSKKENIFVLDIWIPEISHYHRTKFWAKLTFWSVTELRKEEFMRLVPDSQ